MKRDVQARIDRLRAEKTKKKTALEALERIELTQHMAEVYHSVHRAVKNGDFQYFNLPGGRGSCKSSFVSLEIVGGIMEDMTGNTSAIVFRRVAGTLRESCFAQIAWAIDILGVSHLWKATVSPMQYEFTPTGAQIIFRGLDDPSKIKSIRPRKGTFKFVWMEEFSELQGENTVRNVMQSVLRGGDDFKVFRSFNPPVSAANWANMLIAQPDDKALTVLTNYTMIPREWLGESFIYEAERLKALNETLYRHEYLGEATGSGGEVFPQVVSREITQDEIDGMSYIFCGVDFGFSSDPAVFVRVAYDRKNETVYLLDEIFRKHCSNAELARMIIERGYDRTGRLAWMAAGNIGGGFEKQTIVCDSAEPKSIYDLQQLGLRAIPCHKAPGSVLYGVKWLQRRQIVIDPKRTPNAHKEFVSYSYAVDRDGVFLSDLPDRDNHSIDAVRYALNSAIYHTKGQTA